MVSLTEEYIKSLAYNENSFTNAKKIVIKNKILNMHITQSQDLIYGDCSGSGKENYRVSVDFIEPQNPVFRCTCPSRQIPCKHSLALLYQYFLDNSKFGIGEIPEDILSKRDKLEKKVEKKKQDKLKPKKVNVSAFIKKMQSQLEGIELVDRFIDECFTIGFASIANSQIKVYKSNLIKELANYYLPEHAVKIAEFLNCLEMSKLYKGDIKGYYAKATDKLAMLYDLNKKSKTVLIKHIEQKKVVDIDSSYIFTKMGYVWKLDELKNLGLFKEKAEIVQLGFYSYSDYIRKDFVDVGFCMNIGESEIYETLNIRPFKISDRLKPEDTVFEIINTDELYIYPGDMNPRVRWEECTYRCISKQDIEIILKSAKQDYKTVIYHVKQQIKNILADKNPVCLLKYTELVKLGDNFAIIDNDSNIILLDNRKDSNMPDTVSNIELTLKKDDLKDGAVLGMFEHDFETNRLILQPISIVVQDKIIRLLG